MSLRGLPLRNARRGLASMRDGKTRLCERRFLPFPHGGAYIGPPVALEASRGAGAGDDPDRQIPDDDAWGMGVSRALHAVSASVMAR